MSIRLGLSRGFVQLLTSVLLLTFVYKAPASTRDCENRLDPIQTVTLKTLRERNTENLQREAKAYPLPGFDYIENEVKNEQVGFIGPRALQQMLGPDQSFIRTPAPSAAMDTAVNLHDEGRSFPIHVDVQWHGNRTSTAVYASMPKTYKPKSSQYLVGTEYPVVQIHLHGGGTPTATGKNAMSIGQALANANIPVLAMDLPGHGQATRQLEGFTSFAEQIEWTIKIIDKLVDPRVKVIVSGHSWGGQFTAYWRRLTRDPKFRSRIARFITVSPPVDVSLGGDPKLNDQFEEWFEKNWEKELGPQSSPADFEFMDNSLRHGKTSTIGGIFTTIDALDYSMPPLTDKDRAELLPERAFTGDADILTWLGRSEQGLKQWGSDITVLTTGQTWKGEQKTGHNVWDLLTADTKKPYMYEYMTKAALDEAGPQGMGEDVDGNDQAVKTVDQVFRNYANFFLFRQMIAHHDEYVNTPTDKRVAMGKRKVALEKYLHSNMDIQVKAKRESDKRAKAAMEELRAELGIKDSISTDRAVEELAFPPLDETRTQELEAYLAQVAAVDTDIKQNGFEDKDWDQDLSIMHAKFGPALAAAGIKLEDYKAKWDELSKKKNLSKAEQTLRTALSGLHQMFVEKTKAHQGRFGKARDAKLSQLTHPPGVTDYKAAQRELAADRSETRRAALAKYIAQAEGVEAAARHAVETESAHEAAQLEKPTGVTDVADAQKQKDDLEAKDDFVYCPANDPESCALATQVKQLIAKRTELLKGTADGSEAAVSLESLEKQLKDLTIERSQAAKVWDGIWKKNAAAIEANEVLETNQTGESKKEIMTSARLNAYWAELNEKYVAYHKIFLDFEDSNRNFLRGLKEAGQLTAANIIAMTPALKEKRGAFFAAKADFEKFRDREDELKWNEILSGNVQGPPNMVKAATDAAQKIWGTSMSNPSAESLVSRIRVLEERVENTRQEESKVAQELSRAQWQLSQRLTASNVEMPFTIQRVKILELLDLSYNDLIARLKSDPIAMSAIRATLDRWTSYLAVLRAESQTKDAGNY